jgi:hypothetical protein
MTDPKSSCQPYWINNLNRLNEFVIGILTQSISGSSAISTITSPLLYRYANSSLCESVAF